MSYDFLFITIFCYFLPDFTLPLFRFIYCFFKKKLNNCNKCYYWNCKKYFTCYYNEKTLLDVSSYRFKRFDRLSYIFSFLHLFFCILISIFLLVRVYYGS